MTGAHDVSHLGDAGTARAARQQWPCAAARWCPPRGTAPWWRGRLRRCDGIRGDAGVPSRCARPDKIPMGLCSTSVASGCVDRSRAIRDLDESLPRGFWEVDLGISFDHGDFDHGNPIVTFRLEPTCARRVASHVGFQFFDELNSTSPTFQLHGPDLKAQTPSAFLALDIRRDATRRSHLASRRGSL